MRALLLAAGLGTRLRPLTNEIPKCLVPVRGRPLLDYWFENLFESGVELAIVNTHHFADRVEAHVSRSKWRDRIHLAHEVELLGTGGTILRNKDFFERRDFFVAHADNLTDLDVRALWNAHAARPSSCALTMLTFRTDDPTSCGIVELDRNGVVQGFHEKVANPPGNLANAAVYMIGEDVVEFLCGMNKSFIDFSTEVLPAFIGRTYAVEHHGYHRDIGTPASLALANVEFPY